MTCNTRYVLIQVIGGDTLEKFKKQLNKGVLELCILKLLDEENQYGYSIIQKISDRSFEHVILKDGTLYPILYRLEDQGIIESYWETVDYRSKKPRKYYKLTNLGRKYFTDMLIVYEEVTSGVKSILGGKQ